MSTDVLTPLIRRLNQSMFALAALGGALRLRRDGHEAPGVVGPALEAVLTALDAPALVECSPEQTEQGLGLIRTFFVEALDLLDRPSRPPGWTFDDPAILQGIGTSSASMVGRFEALARERPWLAGVLERRGRFLDIGTGVGGIALAAAAAWPGMNVVGIDVWARSLELAAANLEASGFGDRVSFRLQALQDVGGADAWDLMWLPTPFIDGGVVSEALPRLLAALRPGGGLIVGVLPPPVDDTVAGALSCLRTLRNGGHPWSCAEAAALLMRAGFDAVEVPAGQAGMQFVLGRKSLS